MTNYTVDNILLNLKIISKIPENCRVRRNATDGGISIDSSYKLPLILSFKRMVLGDSRQRSISDIKDIIDISISKCNDIINSVVFQKSVATNEDKFLADKVDTEYIQQTEILYSIYNELKNSIHGLLNLKNKYQCDTNITSKIDIIISKVTNYTTIINNKYFIQ
jgi:hypothetical protein